MSREGEHHHLWYEPGASAAGADDRSEPVIDGTAELDDQPVSGAPAALAANQPDPLARPYDPAGTRPKVEPDSLLPARRELPVELKRVAHPRPPGGGDSELLPARREPAGSPEPAYVEPPHAARFQFLLGALGALAVAAVAVGIFVIARPAPTPGPAWSDWHPMPGGGDPASQIANHVASEYRLDNGDQLVALSGGPLTVQGVPVTVAVSSPSSSGANVSLLSGTGVLYKMCGLGPSCSIAQGKPSTRRHLLLRREALELALYSLRYVDGVNQVVVFMPPPPGTTPNPTTPSSANQALFFRPSDLGAQLNRPLVATLQGPTPNVGSIDSSFNAPLVNQITAHTLYKYRVIADQSQSLFLVLQPFALG